ncbi:siderophore biosynthesis protein, putative [Pseudoalteromonas luteoviolacea B = ATCC 29581]|nr:siderophore biosynthesis protein, putative [Pseudoalteromonas luteoviolacea B = ATCC 29581]
MQYQQLASVNPHLQYSYCAIQFDMESVSVADFKTHDIDFPSTLHKAVLKRQGEYLAGRLCAKLAMRNANYAEQQVPIGENRAPQWPQGLLGSITHSKGLAMAVVGDASSARGVGIDIEHFMSAKQEIELQRHILGEADTTCFAKLAKAVACPLTLVFSAKESIFKALYPSVGRFFGFEAAALELFSDKDLRFRITQPLSEKVPKGTLITIHYQLFDGWLLTECEY